MGLKTLGKTLFCIYNKYMRKYVLFLLFVALSWSAATATTLNVLILKRAPRADLSFSQNYVIVSGNEFYGPFPKDTDLKIGPFGKGLQLTLQNKEGKTKKIEIPENKKIHIIRSFEGTLADNNAARVFSVSKRPLPPHALNLQKEARLTSDFVSFSQAKYGGLITYSGPLSVYAQSGVNIVETVELEKYVTHVVNCELGAEKSLNALKAQTVLVRTFGLFIAQYRLQSLEKGNKNWLHFQLFSTPTDQAYNCRKRVNGRELPPDLVKKAVRQTAGEVLIKDNKIAKVQYNTCGNKTAAQKGVICQEEMIKMARKGKSYQSILTSFVPGSRIGRYDLSDFYTKAVQEILKNGFIKPAKTKK